MDKCTCKDCGDRYVGCHDQCEKYRMFKANRKAENEKKREYRDAIEKLQVLSDKADDDIAVCEADTCQYYDGYGDGLDRAIEIVKRGGRDEE